MCHMHVINQCDDKNRIDYDSMLFNAKTGM